VVVQDNTVKTTGALNEFKQALSRLRDDPQSALIHMRRAAELDRCNPVYLSYLGLLKARAERKWADAEELCLAALRMKRTEAQLYLNLADVYLAAGRRESAVETLRRGLKNAPRDPRIRPALNKLARRRSPVFPFLARHHFLNRNLGKLLHRVLNYFAKA
jgi:Flp pilus assembly protein TadD